MNKKQIWFKLDAKLALHGQDMFEKDSKMAPCVVFSNIETGELRLFSTIYVEQKGVDNIIKFLEKK
jgi:hypothetical protein